MSCTTESYPASAQLEQDVHVVMVFEEAVEMNDVTMRHSSVNGYFLCHLQKRKTSKNKSTIVRQLWSLSPMKPEIKVVVSHLVLLMLLLKQ